MSGVSEPDASEMPPADDPAESQFAGHAFKYLRAGLHRYLLRHLRNADDIEDLTQEVYLRLLRFTDREKVRSPQAYVFRVAFNVLYEFRLHRSRAPITFDSEAAAEAVEHLPDEAAQPDDIYEQQRHSARLKHSIEGLPPMQRAVLLMVTRENMSYNDIARKLGISANTVRVHLYRAIGHLRSEVSKE